MKKLIQIGEFHKTPDGLGLLSEADGFPFLVLNSDGVTFDAGPFMGSFCSLKGLSKFTVRRETSAKNSVCSVRLTFTEGDSYLVGRFDYSVSQYNEARCWVREANRKIALKKGNSKVASAVPTRDVSRFDETDVERREIVH